YPAPKLLPEYSYLPCTFVILTNRAEGLRLRRTRRGVCPHPSYNGVKRSLKNSCQLPKGAKRQLSVVSCQLSERKPLCTTWGNNIVGKMTAQRYSGTAVTGLTFAARALRAFCLFTGSLSVVYHAGNLLRFICMAWVIGVLAFKQFTDSLVGLSKNLPQVSGHGFFSRNWLWLVRS